jgi:hypothetical protein
MLRSREAETICLLSAENETLHRAVSPCSRYPHLGDLRKDVTGVADEFPGGQTCVQVPESEGLVPRRGETELAVRGDDDVGDKVVVAV